MGITIRLLPKWWERMGCKEPVVGPGHAVYLGLYPRAFPTVIIPRMDESNLCGRVAQLRGKTGVNESQKRRNERGAVARDPRGCLSLISRGPS